MHRKSLFFAIIIFIGVCIFSSNAFCQLTPAQKPKRVATENIKKKNVKKNEYIRDNDFNHDGKVDAKDRLMWVNKKKPGIQPVLVSKENEDLLEIMDTNGDGSVDQKEMQAFYSTYDINSNGILENSEINAAVE
ncbi:MAG: EF-hand domain-containing protein [Candidatus Omnitrophota bacterium]